MNGHRFRSLSKLPASWVAGILLTSAPGFAQPAASPTTAANSSPSAATAPPATTSPSAATAPPATPAPSATTETPARTETPAPSADAAAPAQAAPDATAPASSEPSQVAPAPPAAAPPATETQIYEPPLPAPYLYGQVPDPLPPKHTAPLRSLWLGARAGWMFPLGSAWQDAVTVDGLCCVYENRGFDDFASSGPMLELDLGARLGRNYGVFALWEFGLLGDGDELGDDFGGQTSAHTHLLGLGLRFSTDPDDVGLLVEIALGWRRFEANWDNGTELMLTDDFLNTRIGLGAEIRLDRYWSLTTLVTLGGGFFTESSWRLADGSETGAFSVGDREGQHVPITLQVGAHFDAFRTKE